MQSHLSKAQKTELHDAIKSAGLDPNDFGWSWSDASFAGDDDACPMLYFKPDAVSCNFSFGLGKDERRYNDLASYSAPTWRGQHCCLYRPTDDAPQAELLQVPWADIMFEFRSWLQYVKREAALSDPWDLDDVTRRALTIVPPDGNTPFAPAEILTISHKLDVFLSEVRHREILQPHQMESLITSVEQIKESTSRLGRLDWRNAFLGAIVGYMITQALPTETMHVLQTLVGGVFTAVFGHGLIALP